MTDNYKLNEIKSKYQKIAENEIDKFSRDLEVLLEINYTKTTLGIKKLKKIAVTTINDWRKN